jgi:protein-tyrosine phosphatase
MRRLEHGIGAGTAYLGAMPGQQEDLDAFFARLERSQVAALVVLNPIEEIRRKSPRYAAAIEGGDPRLPTLHRVPVENFGVPDEETKARFLEAVRHVHTMLSEGSNVFIHCGAGIGRTGMFAAALLLRDGAALQRAVEAVRAAGSNPESGAQMHFLMSIIPSLQDDA